MVELRWVFVVKDKRFLKEIQLAISVDGLCATRASFSLVGEHLLGWRSSCFKHNHANFIHLICLWDLKGNCGKFVSNRLLQRLLGVPWWSVEFTVMVVVNLFIWTQQKSYFFINLELSIFIECEGELRNNTPWNDVVSWTPPQGF